ncbi:MAG: DNA-binding protein [Saprospiraceae bacterium]|nr:DNA-binding protein [Saprospiraceae bacterium]MBK8449586.1 DNA-binding protein [Saprospiraceae bacterium]MBK8484349.1 DNA-binding protein [Saprospiraceae bacterium]MBK9221737.1 DNA-binding protein [Saprospiraceae bacterium]MBK9721326.1 DNA-binding protein [Saprospiraceae bacterium]
MNITLEELRLIKHNLPSGGIKRIADQLSLDEQTVRNYFGAHHLENSGNHIQPGPNGGIVHIEDETILNIAKQLIEESAKQN